MGVEEVSLRHHLLPCKTIAKYNKSAYCFAEINHLEIKNAQRKISRGLNQTKKLRFI